MNDQENIYNYFENIESKEDFREFLNLLKLDYVNNKSDWENNNLENYLSAMERYFSDTINKEKQVSWKLFAEILLASKVYE